ncbi:class I SAM-dependent methyltransferase [Allosphingosinicella deserti]|uniref:SAM-dependent methyltransferase n=1 Tax=Allosphingosinicella deserti TaxID=2116704 RepID=A0A2P7QGG1_9SPHN|nr:class I SAM-dependent methyltransferase [Sphingomonas deserti]PSJ37071.1 SAM-dependent methyltransferase [Sphingomonas deserti]
MREAEAGIGAPAPAGDSAFDGPVPILYDRCLVPLLFAPYAADLARRAAAFDPREILEVAAGTGIVTAALAEGLPGADIVATDLSAAMLECAAARAGRSNVRFKTADAQALPFADGRFDLVVCQFGLMFFPDRRRALREALRVLRPGGRCLLNTWNRIEDNPVTDRVAAAVANLFAGDPPDFFDRLPFGYHDIAVIEADVRASGFGTVSIETITCETLVIAEEAALGLCQGTPLRAELARRGADAVAAATHAAREALAPFDGRSVPMSAHVVTAR